MINKSSHIAAAALLLFGSLTALDVWAQGTKKKSEPITGTVVSIEKGKIAKSYALKVKGEDDTEYDATIAPRTVVTITAKGDSGFVKSGMIVQAKVSALGELEYVAEELSICFGLPVQPQLTPFSAETKDRNFQMTGKILAVKMDANGAGRHSLNVQCGAQTLKVNYAGDAPISVKLADPSLIKEGDALEIDGTLIKAKKQITTKAMNVTLSEPLKSEEFLATLDDPKKGKTAKSTASKSKTATEPKSTEKPATGDKDAADPFGVLKNKKSTKPKAEKTDKAEKPADGDAKTSEPKEEATKPK